MHSLRLSVLLSVFCVAHFTSFTYLSAQVTDQSKQDVLNVTSVVRLVRAGLGDDVVIAAIKTAKAVDFDTSAQSLITMKETGLSNNVIKAILDRQVLPHPGSSSMNAMAGVGKLPNVAPQKTGPFDQLIVGQWKQDGGSGGNLIEFFPDGKIAQRNPQINGGLKQMVVGTYSVRGDNLEFTGSIADNGHELDKLLLLTETRLVFRDASKEWAFIRINKPITAPAPKVTERPAATVDDEARSAAKAFWLKRYSQCGDSFYARNYLVADQSRTFLGMIQYREFSWIVVSDSLTQADRLNGIEWKGRTELRYSASRWRPKSAGWSDWQGHDNQATTQTLSAIGMPSGFGLGGVADAFTKMVKKNGRWDVSNLTQETRQALSCSETR